jgi:hypothetical protein
MKEHSHRWRQFTVIGCRHDDMEAVMCQLHGLCAPNLRKLQLLNITKDLDYIALSDPMIILNEDLSMNNLAVVRIEQQLARSCIAGCLSSSLTSLHIQAPSKMAAEEAVVWIHTGTRQSNELRCLSLGLLDVNPPSHELHAGGQRIVLPSLLYLCLGDASEAVLAYMPWAFYPPALKALHITECRDEEALDAGDYRPVDELIRLFSHDERVVNPYASMDNLTLKLCQGIAVQRLLGLFTALRFLTLSECQMYDEWVEVPDPGEIALGFLTCPTLEVLTLSPREEDRFLSSSRRDKLTRMVSHRMQRGCL